VVVARAERTRRRAKGRSRVRRGGTEEWQDLGQNQISR